MTVCDYATRSRQKNPINPACPVDPEDRTVVNSV